MLPEKAVIRSANLSLQEVRSLSRRSISSTSSSVRSIGPGPPIAWADAAGGLFLRERSPLDALIKSLLRPAPGRLVSQLFEDEAPPCELTGWRIPRRNGYHQAVMRRAAATERRHRSGGP